MNGNFKDHFSAHSDSYSQYRPDYPPTLFEYLASLYPSHHIAWDCATGSGQAARQLAGHFERVIATDASRNQILAATPCDRVEFRVAPAEHSGLADASVDLVTVAQALHWFDLNAFYSEAKRVLKPGGVLAVWSYNLLKIDPAIDAVIEQLYHQILQGYWPAERVQVEQGYADLPFPFTHPSSLPNFAMTANWDLPHLLGYLGTWSAVQRMRRATGEEPLDQIYPQLARQWGEPSRSRKVRWPLSIRVGYHH